MKLTAFERMLLINVLPAKDNALTMRIVGELKDALSFTEAEHADFEIEQEPNSTLVRWNEKGAEPAEIKVGPVASSIIRDQFAQLDTDKQLTLEHMPLYERFAQEASQ